VETPRFGQAVVLAVGIVRFYSFKLTFLLKIRFSHASRFTQLKSQYFSTVCMSRRERKKSPTRTGAWLVVSLG